MIARMMMDCFAIPSMTRPSAERGIPVIFVTATKLVMHPAGFVVTNRAMFTSALNLQPVQVASVRVPGIARSDTSAQHGVQTKSVKTKALRRKCLSRRIGIMETLNVFFIGDDYHEI